FQQISISGQAFNDLNSNGSKDAGEPGLAGWTIFLDSNNNGVLGAGECSVLTEGNGNYCFTNLASGTYRVREVTPAGWVRTTANPSDILLSSGSLTGVNFGNFQQISISGQAFNDTNGNGSKDLGEPGLSGWTIFLDNNNNGTLDVGEPSTLTDVNGNYGFFNLGPGTYRVREVAPAGWVRTTLNPPDITASSGSSVGGVNFGNFLAISISGVNFGNFQQISISGQAFNDANGNGTTHLGEQRLFGWTVFLDSNNNGALDAGEPSTLTDSNGNYAFTNLGPGTYRVREVAP